MFLLKKIKALQHQFNISIEEPKEKYYTKLSSRLANPLTSLQKYWSILKTFLNNNKIPCIPPLFHENKFITYLLFHSSSLIISFITAELFNHFFVNHVSPLSNNSVLSIDLPHLIKKCLDSIHFSSSDIAKIISLRSK